jgi:hypothetical protein
MKRNLVIPGLSIFLLLILLSFSSCKKCITCHAYDSSSGEIKFEERSCANGPLQDDWVDGIKDAYPSPQYNTVCK